jgi:hypothetical protein
MTKKAVLLNLLFVLVTAALAPGATRLVSEAHVPNEIIVKFRRNAAASIEKSLAESTTGSNLVLIDSLGELNKKYSIREAQSLFKNFRKKREEIKALLKKDKALLNKKEKRYLTRLKRAQKGAGIPELDRIYKLQIKLEAGQSLQGAVAAYNNNPDVEYAELNYIVSINTTPNDPLYPLQWSLTQALTIDTGTLTITCGLTSERLPVIVSMTTAMVIWMIYTATTFAIMMAIHMTTVATAHIVQEQSPLKAITGWILPEFASVQG